MGKQYNILKMKDAGEKFYKVKPIIFDLPFRLLIVGKSQLSGRASATAEHAEHLFRQCSAAPALTQAKSRRDLAGIHHRDATGAQSCQWPVEAILFQSACYCRGRF